MTSRVGIWGRGETDCDFKTNWSLGLSERPSKYFFLFWVTHTQVLICTVKDAPNQTKKAQDHENNGTCQGIQRGRVGDASSLVLCKLLLNGQAVLCWGAGLHCTSVGLFWYILSTTEETGYRRDMTSFPVSTELICKEKQHQL